MQIRNAFSCCQRQVQQLQEKPFVKGVQHRLQFLNLFIRDPIGIGSVTPSSPQLCKELVSKFPSPEEADDQKLPPQVYLEVGGGTGVITKELVKKMRHIDKLYVVEINNELANILKREFSSHCNVFIVRRNIMHWDAQQKFDGIVSSLPLNAFNHLFVKQYLTKLTNLSHAGTLFSDFEYRSLPAKKIKLLTWTDRCFCRTDRKEFEKLLRIKKTFYNTHGATTTTVKQKPNTASVHHLKFKLVHK